MGETQQVVWRPRQTVRVAESTYRQSATGWKELSLQVMASTGDSGIPCVRSSSDQHGARCALEDSIRASSAT
jgi:hypothetical protein